jgi:hypothetical protein
MSTDDLSTTDRGPKHPHTTTANVSGTTERRTAEYWSMRRTMDELST